MKPTITLADVHGSINTYEVSNATLMQIWEVLETNGQKVEKLSLPDYPSADGIVVEEVQPEVKPVAVAIDLPHTVREGTKAGYVEILFDGPVCADTSKELRSHGFRFSPRKKLWFGEDIRRPNAYLALPVQRNETVYPSTKPVAKQEPKAEPAKDDNAFMSSLANLMGA